MDRIATPGLRRLAAAGLLAGLMAAAALAAHAAQPPAPASPPAAVKPKGVPDQATIDHYMTLGRAKYGDNFMSAEDAKNPEIRRLATYYLMVDEEEARRKTAASAGGRRGAAPKMSFADVMTFLGEEAYADQTALAAKVEAADKAH